jgi:hypothetical protein
MSALSIHERPANETSPRESLVPSAQALLPPRVSHADLARFVRDPRAFATAGGDEPEALVRGYLEGLERRLAGALGAPPRLATLGTSTARRPLPAGRPDVDVDDDGGSDPGKPGNAAPRMAGAVVLAMAVVAVAVATAAAGASAVLARREAN